MKRKLTLVLCFSFVLLLTLSIALPTSALKKTFNPSEDTYVSQDDKKANYGGQEYMYLRRIDYEYLDDEEIIGLLKFDISDIPVGAEVEEATLSLYCFSAGQTLKISIRSCSLDWEEYEVDWDHKPNLGTTLDSQKVGEEDKWYEWDVTEGITKSKIEKGEVAFAVKCDTTVDSWILGAGFYLKERDYSIPKLQVEYTEAAAPEETTPPPEETPPPETPEETPEPTPEEEEFNRAELLVIFVILIVILIVVPVVIYKIDQERRARKKLFP